MKQGLARQSWCVIPNTFPKNASPFNQRGIEGDFRKLQEIHPFLPLKKEGEILPPFSKSCPTRPPKSASDS